MLKIMKRLILIICIAISSYFLNAQSLYKLEGKTINNTETGTWYGINIPRSVPTKLVFHYNSITSVNSDGYLLQAGDENPSPRDNNLDNMEIVGNLFTWRGDDDSTIITHGVFTGYNINSKVSYNKLNNVPYGIIFKSGSDSGENMTFTTGGCSYNICKNGVFAVRMKGINGVKVFNNTLYSDSDNSKFLLLITSNQDRAKPAPSTGTKVFNNIFFTTKNIPMISIESESLAGFESDYNIFWNTGGEPIFTIDGVKYTWQQWTAMGYDTHSKIMDPKFNNTNDFVPEKALDFGKNLGKEWEKGLSPSATWIPGQPPATTIQNGNWQIGAIIKGANVEDPTTDDSESFNIFPNPSNGVFQLKVNNMPEDGVTVEIKNIHGQKIIEKKITESITNWSINHLSGNILFITLNGGNIHMTKRVVISNMNN
jgi:hypothetical protein